MKDINEIKSHLSYVITLLFMFSCAYVPKKSVEPILNSPKASKEMECEKINARFGLMDHLPFEVKHLRHSELVEKNDQDQSETILLKKIKESGNFILNNEGRTDQELILGFTEYRETDNYGYLWIPVFTLGIIPALVDTHYSLGLRIFDKDGKLLREYKSSIVDFDYYVGLWFIPIAKKDGSLNLREIEKRYLPLFFDELMNKVKADNIIKCK